MPYNMPLYRPPSEAKSLILQLTFGCSHNKCTFCYMYKTKKYRVKTSLEMDEHINWAKAYSPMAKRIFLADGNVLAMNTEQLRNIIVRLFNDFPALERVSAYAGPRDILAKSDAELVELKKTGLEILYLGVESGSTQVLKNVKKGVTSEEMIEAGQKVIKAGFELSCMVISGLGGKKMWEEHARESARVINAINPNYFALLTLIIDKATPLSSQIELGEFVLLQPYEVIDEVKLIIEKLELTNCVFRSNHPSNYLTLKGILNKDKDILLEMLTKAQQLQGKDLRPEGWRVL